MNFSVIQLDAAVNPRRPVFEEHVTKIRVRLDDRGCVWTAEELTIQPS
jgi:hypothetical protein